MSITRILERAVDVDLVEELASTFVMNGWVILNDKPLVVYEPSNKTAAIIEVDGTTITIGNDTFQINPTNTDAIESVVSRAERDAQKIPAKDPGRLTTLLSLIMTGRFPQYMNKFSFEGYQLVVQDDRVLIQHRSYTLAVPIVKETDFVSTAMTTAQKLFERLVKTQRDETLYAEAPSLRRRFLRRHLRALARELGTKVRQLSDSQIDVAGTVIDLSTDPPRVIKDMEVKLEKLAPLENDIITRGIVAGQTKKEIRADLEKLWQAVYEKIAVAVRKG